MIGDAEAIIARQARAVVDKVVAEAMENVRTKPRSLREARLVKKFDVRGPWAISDMLRKAPNA